MAVERRLESDARREVDGVHGIRTLNALGVAGQTPHVVGLLAQPLGKAAADVAADAGDEDAIPLTLRRPADAGPPWNAASAARSRPRPSTRSSTDLMARRRCSPL